MGCKKLTTVGSLLLLVRPSNNLSLQLLLHTVNQLELLLLQPLLMTASASVALPTPAALASRRQIHPTSLPPLHLHPTIKTLTLMLSSMTACTRSGTTVGGNRGGRGGCMVEHERATRQRRGRSNSRRPRGSTAAAVVMRGGRGCVDRKGS